MLHEIGASIEITHLLFLSLKATAHFNSLYKWIPKQALKDNYIRDNAWLCCMKIGDIQRWLFLELLSQAVGYTWLSWCLHVSWFLIFMLGWILTDCWTHCPPELDCKILICLLNCVEAYLIEIFESREHLIFASKETKLGELCVIINKGDIIFES